MKPQTIRLADVFVIGPLMMWVAVRARGVGDLPRAALFVFGAATVVYNGANYLERRKQLTR